MTPMYKSLMNTDPNDLLLLILSEDLANQSYDSVPLSRLKLCILTCGKTLFYNRLLHLFLLQFLDFSILSHLELFCEDFISVNYCAWWFNFYSIISSSIPQSS